MWVVKYSYLRIALPRTITRNVNPCLQFEAHLVHHDRLNSPYRPIKDSVFRATPVVCPFGQSNKVNKTEVTNGIKKVEHRKYII